MAVTTPPPSLPSPRRPRWPWILGLLAILLLAVGGMRVAHTWPFNGKPDLRTAASDTVPTDEPTANAAAAPATTDPTATPSPSDSATPTPTPSDSDAATGTAPTCTQAVTPPSRSLALTRPQPAGDPASTQDLTALHDNGHYDTLYYMGVAVDANTMVDYVNQVCAAHMVAVIGADPVYNESSAADAATWTKTVADNPGTLGFVISMNTQAPGTGDSVKELVEATNDRAKLIKQASGDKLPVYCLMDWFGTDLSARNAIMKKFDACDLHIVVYLPLPHSKKYGNPAWTADAGTSARALDGTDSITVTQAMSWSHVDPQFAKDWGFPNSPAPAANQVAGMAKLGMRGIDDNRPGALRVLVFTLENKVGGTPDADDTKYLVGCGNAVYTQALS